MSKRKVTYTTDFYRQIKKIRSKNEIQLLKTVRSNNYSVNVSGTQAVRVIRETVRGQTAENLHDQITASSSRSDIKDPSTSCDVLDDDNVYNESAEESSEDNEFNYFDEQLNLMNDVRQWALTHKFSLKSISDLLKILHKHGKLDSSIKDARTLLNTPPSVTIMPMGYGQFWYDGIEHNLQHYLLNMPQVPRAIQLIINIDGISPFSSTGKEFWPILMTIADMPTMKPIAVAIYYGRGKPPLEHFFANFIEEMKLVLENGILVSDQKISVKIKCFTCDTPARIFIKGTPYFNAADSSCMKCTVDGVFNKLGRHMSYPRFDFFP